MGNCVACHSQLKEQTTSPLIEGRETKFDASVAVEKVNTASSSNRKVQHGEAYHLGKPFVPCSMTNNNRKLKPRIVKIVVTTEQLELLLSGSKKFQIKTRVSPVRKSSVLRRCPKWLPSLPTILE